MARPGFPYERWTMLTSYDALTTGVFELAAAGRCAVGVAAGHDPGPAHGCS